MRYVVPPMVDAPTLQIWRRIAIIFAYSLFIGFGSAVLLSLYSREFDTRSWIMIAIMTAGAFIGSCMVLAFLRYLKVVAPAFRFPAMTLLVFLLTFAFEGLIAGAQFYATALSVHNSFTTIEGWLELVFTTLHGIAYFYVFGFSMFWPALLAAALLFSLATLTLQPKLTEQ